MKKVISVTAFAMAIISFLVISLSGTARGKQNRLKKVDTHKFTLYQAPHEKDPYSVRYPIKLDEQGLISVTVEIGGGKIHGDGKPFKIWIIEARGIHDDTNRIDKKFIRKVAYFRTKDSITYPVDAQVLNLTKGEFIIMLSNTGTKTHAVGTITITYPAEEKTAAQGKVRHKRE